MVRASQIQVDFANLTELSGVSACSCSLQWSNGKKKNSWRSRSRVYSLTNSSDASFPKYINPHWCSFTGPRWGSMLASSPSFARHAPPSFTHSLYGSFSPSPHSPSPLPSLPTRFLHPQHPHPPVSPCLSMFFLVLFVSFRVAPFHSLYSSLPFYLYILQSIYLPFFLSSPLLNPPHFLTKT